MLTLPWCRLLITLSVDHSPDSRSTITIVTDYRTVIERDGVRLAELLASVAPIAG
jgi:hypothetical protein